jgi:hypothetical protein
MPIYLGNNEINTEYVDGYGLGTLYLGNQVVQSGQPTFISASGGTITYDGNFAIHTFTSTGSSTFTVHNIGQNFINNYYDILLVGGGGGGVSSIAVGGGGAGGQVLYSQSLSFLSTGSYTVSVGAGGNINSTSIWDNPAVTSLRGFKGTGSLFTGTGVSLEVFGGGPGCIGEQFPSSSAQALSEKIANGGGMGAGTGIGGPISGSIGTVFNGGGYGGYNAQPQRFSGGGSGASTSGSGITTTQGGLPAQGANGVDGISVSISGTPTFYGGSGAGARNATGGNGGGGNSNSRGADNGVNGFGGGGGGSLELSFGTPDAGKGGSGTVIIRYQYK